jgi:hypothetical protein
MSLNGWQRLGVVASAVWFLGAGLFTLNHRDNEILQFASQVTLNCESGYLNDHLPIPPSCAMN